MVGRSIANDDEVPKQMSPLDGINVHVDYYDSFKNHPGH